MSSLMIDGDVCVGAGIADVAVYGVEVPHCGGKGGMAAITLKLAEDADASINDVHALDWAKLASEVVLIA